jgi:small subunit ribosomal protein S3
LGRKVHPRGFRLGYIYHWDSRWYAEGEDYTRLLEEDLALRRKIGEQAANARISRVEIERLPSQVHITIHTSRPGVVIGRRGANVKALRRELERISSSRVRVDVEEVEQPELDAQLVAENIAGQLERRISHGRAMRRAAGRAMQAGAEGVRIECKGRLRGAEMGRRDWVLEGRVPLHTLRADIDFARAEALTTFGYIGVKVWIHKGEVLPEMADLADHGQVDSIK